MPEPEPEASRRLLKPRRPSPRSKAPRAVRHSIRCVSHRATASHTLSHTPSLAPSVKLIPIQRAADADQPIVYNEKKGSKLARLFGSSKKKPSVGRDISGPTGFQQHAHVGWDALNGFDVRVRSLECGVSCVPPHHCWWH